MGIVRGSCLVLTISLGLASTAAAQSAPKTGSFLSQKIFGVEGGVNSAALQSADGVGSVWTPGFLIGFFVTGGPNAVTWQVGGQLQRKGGGIGHATVRLTYIEVPLFLRINLRPDRQTRFHLLAGATAGYRLQAFLLEAGQEFALDGGKSYDISAVVGAGVDIGRFEVGGRFSQSLTPTAIVVEGVSTRNRVWAIVMGFRTR